MSYLAYNSLNKQCITLKFLAMTAEWPDFFSGANVFHQKWRHANEIHQKSFLTLSFRDFLGFFDTENFWRGKNRIKVSRKRLRWVRFMTKLNKFYLHQQYSFFIVPTIEFKWFKNLKSLLRSSSRYVCLARWLCHSK